MEIKITSKFNVGDTAYKFNTETNKLEEFHIKSISVHIYENMQAFGYHSEEPMSYTAERYLFASKEEFINQLTE